MNPGNPWCIMRILVVLLACTVVYAAWPYATLYQLSGAIQHGDMQTLTADVDWDSVRDGLKEDIADGIMGQPAARAVISSDLPPFGASFVQGMAGNMVDATVTPDNIAAGLTTLSTAASAGSGPVQVWAWFTGPMTFEASIKLATEQADDPPIRLDMQLVEAGWGYQWRVIHASVPSEVLTQLTPKQS